MAIGRRSLPAKNLEHTLDMLAGAEPVDAVIDAAAGIRAVLETADLDLVGAAGFRVHAERTVNRLSRLQWLDGANLGAPAPTSELDLFLVGGAPALQLGRTVEHRAGPRLAARSPSLRDFLCRRVGPDHRV